MKCLSNHKVIPYADLQSGKIDIRNLHQMKYCKVYEEQVLRFICETCGELIVDHPAAGHTLVNLENAAKGQRTKIEQLISSSKKSKMH